MIVIDEIRIERGIPASKFACDVLKCKGACCTLPGGRGAPLREDEIIEIERVFPLIKKYLPEVHLRTIQEKGMYEGEPHYRATTCVNNRDCVFVYYENEIARCAFERAFIAGETTWRKPLSCHLFPLRVSAFPGTIVRYEKIEQCATAIERGEVENITLHDFLKEPLVRRFGEAWYQEFKQACEEKNRNGKRSSVT